MSHIVSLRSASLRALRSSSSTVAVATKCRTNLHQQQYSFSTLPLSSTRILSIENNKFIKRVRNCFDNNKKKIRDHWEIF
jgi:hypothetical protein